MRFCGPDPDDHEWVADADGHTYCQACDCDLDDFAEMAMREAERAWDDKRHEMWDEK
jgi:hypothetical protein